LFGLGSDQDNCPERHSYDENFDSFWGLECHFCPQNGASKKSFMKCRRRIGITFWTLSGILRAAATKRNSCSSLRGSSPIFPVAFRSQEVIRTERAQLYGYPQSSLSPQKAGRLSVWKAPTSATWKPTPPSLLPSGSICGPAFKPAPYLIRGHPVVLSVGPFFGFPGQAGE
jgi:hypothetical protein